MERLMILLSALLTVPGLMAAPLADLPWIGDGKPEPKSDEECYLKDPARMYFADLVLPKGTDSADFDIACAGMYELSVNGQKVSYPLAPLWSPFNRTIYADSYTVKGLMPYPATNTVAVLLGNGFYNPLPLRYWGYINIRWYAAHGRPCFKLAVKGIEKPLVWNACDTPIERNNVYLGCEFNALKAEALRMRPTLRPAAEVTGPKGRIVPRRAPANTFGPGNVVVTPKWLKNGEAQIVDFKLNRSWIPTFVFGEEKAGTKIEIIYGERLNADGTVNPLTQTAGQIKGPGKGGPGAPDLACQRDVYICRGEKGDGFTPKFTWHIFRYAEIRGATKPVKSAIAQPVHADLVDTPKAADFKARLPEFEAIHEVARNTFLANVIGGIESDCPGRERFGYGGDIVAVCEAYAENWDMKEFYLKVLQDFADEASDDGWLTETAPYVGIGDGRITGAPRRSGPISWTVAVPVLVDLIVRRYPDAKDRALAFYPVCSRYARLVDKACPDGIIPTCIGDHEALERATNEVTATAHWYRFAEFTARFAGMLAKSDEQREFAAIAAKIKSAFAAKHIKDGIVDNGSQSAQAIALYLGLVPAEQLAAAEARLVKAIEEKDYAPYTGIFSTRYMLMYLSEHGKQDIAEKIVLHRGFPGYLHMLERGATTLWETWKESDDVYSNCHPMFGSVDEWILKYGSVR